MFLSAVIVRPEHCKVMDSKMRPLWLDFSNLDNLGDNILHIFKNGDGKCTSLTIVVVGIHTLYMYSACTIINPSVGRGL